MTGNVISIYLDDRTIERLRREAAEQTRSLSQQVKHYLKIGMKGDKSG